MTDLGVFCIASGAIWSGENPYATPDWHGWHYQYPPALAILFLPLAEPVPLWPPALPPGVPKTAKNTPWGFGLTGKNYHGLHADNVHFFFSVAVWYVLNVLGILLSAHALACAIEGKTLRSPPPRHMVPRRVWWLRRLLPLAVCAGSLLTDLSRGQADILMLTAISIALYFITTRESFKAGLCLAFPATIKLFPPLLLAYPFLRRQWRTAFGVVSGLVILLVVLPVMTLGPKRSLDLYQCWFEVLAKPALGQGADTSRAKELTGMGSTDNQSLLASIHNWANRSLPGSDRPAQAAAWERNAVYATGAMMLICALWAIGFRRSDSPHELLVIAGLLIGIGLVISPIVHNFYYLLMLPLIAALIDSGLLAKNRLKEGWKFIVPVAAFMATDLLTRIPGIGSILRDYGVTTLTLLCLMSAGAVLLFKNSKLQHRSSFK